MLTDGIIDFLKTVMLELCQKSMLSPYMLSLQDLYKKASDRLSITSR